MALIKIEGQEIPIEDEIAQDDNLLRAALQASWPDAKTATFARSKKGEQLVVTVTKKAGTKGGLIEALLTAPDGLNPAIEMSRKLAAMSRAGELSQARISELMPDIQHAAGLGERDLDAGQSALRDLLNAQAIPGEALPTGF